MKKAPADPLRPALAALFACTAADPHAVLGMHTEKSGIVVRVYDPAAESVLIRRKGSLSWVGPG